MGASPPLVAATIIGLMLVAGCGTSSPQHGALEAGIGPKAAAAPSAASPVPGWTTVCVHPNGKPAPQFVGITVAQAKQLAQRAGRTLVVYGAAGKCLTQGGKGYAYPVAVNIDRLGPGGSIPKDARILTAQY